MLNSRGIIESVSEGKFEHLKQYLKNTEGKKDEVTNLISDVSHHQI